MNNATSLPLRAENNPKFYGRFKWLGLGAIAFLLYCLYDGYVNYPDQQRRGVALMALAEEELPRGDLEAISSGAHGPHDVYIKLRKRLPDFPELKEAWEASAQKEGWDPAPPEKLRTDGDILGQYIMAGLSALGAAYFLSTVARTSGRWFELNESGVTSRWGESFSLDTIISIDKRQWRDKGIARLRYTAAGGGQRTFVVDDYKYHKPTTDRILFEIERRVGVDKIKNGRPEPDPDALPDPDAPPEAAAPQPGA